MPLTRLSTVGLLQQNGGAQRSVIPAALCFQRYAARSKSTIIEPIASSTVDRGTRFEMGTLQYLTQTFPDMHLIRTGGANDGGVDLLGWWHLTKQPVHSSSNNDDPPLPSHDRMRVVVQCKAEQKKLGPIHVRELRGAATKIMAGSSTGLAVLASTNGFSKQCLLQGLAWDFPLLFLHLLAPPDRAMEKIGGNEDNLACVSLLPNEALSQAFLRGKMEVKHITSLDKQGQKQTVPVMYLNGKRVKHLRTS